MARERADAKDEARAPSSASSATAEGTTTSNCGRQRSGKRSAPEPNAKLISSRIECSACRHQETRGAPSAFLRARSLSRPLL
eukprot:3430580-Pleurochrysis_carterae.AAC.2